MKYLSELIHSFTEEESELIVKHYLLKRNSYSKRLKLFNMIRHEDIKDDRVAAKRLYNRAPNAAFSQLKKRLREDILNLMLVFNFQSDNFCGYMEAEIRASKLIMQGRILIKRGLADAGTVLLKKAFTLAGEYEAFEVQALAYEALKSYSDNNDVIPELHDMEMQFSKNVNILYDLINLRITNSQSAEISAAHLTRVPENLTTLPLTDYQPGFQDPDRSSRLRFQYTMKRTEEFCSRKMYQRARETVEEILPILDHEDQVLTPGQKGVYYLQFAEILLCLRFYREAIFYAQKSCQYLKPLHDRHLSTLLLQFRGYFYQRKTDDADRILDQVVCVVEESCSKLRNECELFRAWLAFLKEDTKESIKLLNNCFKLSGKYTEVSLNGKLLELLNLLKMKDFGWFDYKLDSFRKYLHNSPENLNLSRFKLLYKLFNVLKSHQYNMQVLREDKCQELLKSLNECGKPSSWNPMGQELMPVDQWLIASIPEKG